MSSPYSKEKMAWWLVRDGGLPDAPKQLQLIISDLCNQNCNFCAYRMDGYTSNELFMADSIPAKYGHNNPLRQIPTQKALALLDDAADMGILGVQFTGGGEPTVHPDHPAIFAHALDRGMQASLVSNGVRWSDHLVMTLLPRFAWCRISIDAGEAETYARVRQSNAATFAKVWDNVRKAAMFGRKEPLVVGVGFVVTPDNWQEIRTAAMRARDAGADNIRLSAMFNPDGALPYQDIYQQIVESVRDVKADLTGGGFTVIEQFTDRMEDLFQGAPDYSRCAYQHYNTYVGGDLNIYRCCVLAYNRRGLLGSVKDQGLASAWARSKENRAQFDARGCQRCQFNDKNRIMDYLLGPQPVHAEFP